MNSQEFAKFVARQQSAVGASEEDAAPIREEWLENLDFLYRKVEDFLKDFVTEASVTYTYGEVTLEEERIGIYQAKTMTIRIGRQQVLLEPIGTLLIACRGRVDVIGWMGRAQLVLVNQKVKGAADLVKVTVNMKGEIPTFPTSSSLPISWAWKILSPRKPTAFVDLDKESFFDVLVEVSRA